jgi:hypothetical protein
VNGVALGTDDQLRGIQQVGLNATRATNILIAAVAYACMGRGHWNAIDVSRTWLGLSW